MSIHKLQDLCYAYSVADPVREMLFALQDRITELEAQRKPLTIAEVEQILVQHNYEIHGDRARYIVRMTEEAHNIKEGT